MKVAWRATAIVVCTACAPAPTPARAQWVVTVHTDVPVPALADRLAIEVVGASGSPCSECQRLFDAGHAELWPLSFGIAADSIEEGALLRARLYRFREVVGDAEPDSALTIEAVARLSVPSAVERADLVLGARCFGQPAELGDTSCAWRTGKLAKVAQLSRDPDSDALEPGAWPERSQKSCSEGMEQGMVCIEGGAFLLGAAHHIVRSMSAAFDLSSEPQRLLVMEPFALDVDEFSVGSARRILHEQDLGSAPKLGNSGPPYTGCTYLGAEDVANDALPLNCVTRDLGAKLCAARGKRLPSEAEWEYAAGNENLETTYPWGEDDAVCEHAIVEHAADTDPSSAFACRFSADREPAGLFSLRDTRDTSLLGLKNLGGNVAEWVADQFDSYKGECWRGASTQRSPVCRGPTALSVRGASWASFRTSSKVFIRQAAAADAEDARIGFRCAKSL